MAMGVTGKKVKEAGPRKGIEGRIAGIEERLAKLEENQTRIMDLLRDRGLMVREDGGDQAAYDRAIRELAKGNKKPLESYLKRGGKIPIQEKPQGKG
jgi:hypothetical protein